MGLIVIEFRDRADRFPALRGVTVLTGNIQTAVRTQRTRAIGTGGALVQPPCAHTEEKDYRQRHARKLPSSQNPPLFRSRLRRANEG